MTDANRSTSLSGAEKSAASTIELFVNADSALKSGDTSRALIWATQLVAASPTDNDHDERLKTNLLLSSIALSATGKTIESAMRSGEIFEAQKKDLMIVLGACEQIVAFARANDRGLAFVTGHTMIARARTVLQALATKTRRKHLSTSTSASDLDTFLNELWAIAAAARSFAGNGKTLQTVPPTRRVALSATALSNARYSLCFWFSRSMSDWDKALVYCHQVKDNLLPGLEIYHVASANKSIAAAITALESRDYRASEKALAAAEKTMANYTWKHDD